MIEQISLLFYLSRTSFYLYPKLLVRNLVMQLLPRTPQIGTFQKTSKETSKQTCEKATEV